MKNKRSITDAGLPSRDNTIRNLNSCAATLAVAALATTASAATPTAFVWFKMDRGASESHALVGTPAGVGKQTYAATFTLDDGVSTIYYNLTVDFKTDPTTSVMGSVIFTNNDTRAHAFHAGFDVGVCPGISGGTLSGGSAKITLTADGPGAITCASEQDAILEPTADGKSLQSLFWCPFQIATSGSGTMSSTAQYGLPGIIEQGPETATAIGERIALDLTPGDKANVWVTLMFKDKDGIEASMCPWDLDVSGEVDAVDLTTVISNWEMASFCPTSLEGDFNADGVVGAEDLVDLLIHWGQCGG